eukprot:scaffold4445_cov262-Chaetoceros_neogracile.AAC.14
MKARKPLVIFIPGLYSSTLEPTISSSCSQVEETPSSTPTPPVAATGGLSGCLRDKWNLPKSLLLSLMKGNRGHSGLTLPLTWSKDESGIYVQTKDDLEALGCLKFVMIELLRVLRTLHDNNFIELHEIVWDWRRSFEEAEISIASKIASICSEDARQATILSHSTGAMLTWPTISKHPEWFSAWVNIAGCLLAGGNAFLADFDHGWNKSFINVVSKEALFSFPGMYTYFPVKEQQHWEGVGESDYVAPDGSFHSWHDIDIHDIGTWEKFKIGIFAWKNGHVTEEERIHLKHCLATAKRFRQTRLMRDGIQPHDPRFLDKDPSAYEHLKIICYGSSTRQTHSAYEVNMEDQTMDVSKSKLTVSGDGTLITQGWQTVPGGLIGEIVMAEEASDHVTLVNDKKLHDILLDIFFAGDELKKASAISLLK